MARRQELDMIAAALLLVGFAPARELPVAAVFGQPRPDWVSEAAAHPYRLEKLKGRIAVIKTSGIVVLVDEALLPRERAATACALLDRVAALMGGGRRSFALSALGPELASSVAGSLAAMTGTYSAKDLLSSDAVLDANAEGSYSLSKAGVSRDVAVRGLAGTDEAHALSAPGGDPEPRPPMGQTFPVAFPDPLELGTQVLARTIADPTSAELAGAAMSAYAQARSTLVAQVRAKSELLTRQLLDGHNAFGWPPSVGASIDEQSAAQRKGLAAALGSGGDAGATVAAASSIPYLSLVIGMPGGGSRTFSFQLGAPSRVAGKGSSAP